MERKRDIRIRIRKKREALTFRQRQTGTKVIAAKICSHPWFLEAEDIYCYLDFDGEPGTREIIERAWRLGKRVWVPKVSGARMDFYQITSYEEVSPGRFGILEPNVISAPASGEEGLMVMPGIAFDRRRNRIGYGKGYYDRYLSVHSGLRTIAAAFACQIVDEIDAGELDIAPMVLVTDQALYERSNFMDLPGDPVMLLSVINTKLRDQYDSLEALCEDMQVEKEELIRTLAGINYEYDENRGRFV